MPKRRERLGHDVVDERPVVADQQQRPREFLDRGLQQIERLHVEVVRRLIEDQHVRGPCEQARQQQAIALATGERRDRGTGALRREQEVREVAADVLAFAVDLDPVGSRADRVADRAREVKLLAHLVEVGDLHVRAEAHAARVRRQLPEDQPYQRRLADAIRAEDADAITAHHGHRQVRRDQLRSKGLRHAIELGDELAGALARVDREPQVPEALAPCGALDPEPLEPAHAPFIARAPRLDATADPHLFLCPELVELAIGDRLGRQLLALARLVLREIAGVGAQVAAVELDDPRRDTIEKVPVVRDEDRRGTSE